MRPVGVRLLNRPAAMLEQRRVLDRDRRLKIGFVLIFFQLRTFDETSLRHPESPRRR